MISNVLTTHFYEVKANQIFKLGYLSSAKYFFKLKTPNSRFTTSSKMIFSHNTVSDPLVKYLCFLFKTGAYDDSDV